MSYSDNGASIFFLLCMSQITFVDFVMYELLDQHFLFEPTILNDYPNLKVHSPPYLASVYIKLVVEDNCRS